MARLRLPNSVSALAERDFRVVWIGQAVSLTGTWMQTIAQGLVVLSLWNSAFALGAVNFANAVPTLVITLFGGVLADRMDKRKILLVSQALMAMLALTIGVLVATHTIRFWMVLCITAMLGVVIGYDMPAFGAYLPGLVPPRKIRQVIALNSSTFHGSRMIGPAIAGVAIAALGLAAAFFLNAASFIAVLIALLLVRHRPPPRAADAPRMSAVQGIREGLAHARSRPHLQALLLLAALNVFFVFPPMAILMPYYATRVLHGGPGVLSALMASSGVGSVLGAIALILWSGRARAAQLWFGVLAGPVGLATLAVTRAPALACVAVGITSIAFSSQFALVQTIVQESTPEQFRGRVTSLVSIIFSGVTPFAGIGASAIAAVIGLPTVMAGAAIGYLLCGSAVLRFGAGGVRNVIRAAHDEFEAIVADDLAAEPAAALAE